jgi:hypothetical protein
MDKCWFPDCSDRAVKIYVDPAKYVCFVCQSHSKEPWVETISGQLEGIDKDRIALYVLAGYELVPPTKTARVYRDQL